MLAMRLWLLRARLCAIVEAERQIIRLKLCRVKAGMGYSVQKDQEEGTMFKLVWDDAGPPGEQG